MDPGELSDAEDELRSRPLLSLRLGARTADAADAIVSASRFSSYSFRFTPLHYLLFVSFHPSSGSSHIFRSLHLVAMPTKKKKAPMGELADTIPLLSGDL